MNTVEIDEWLTHLQSEVDDVGDELHQLITTLIAVGVLLAATIIVAAMYVYALWHGTQP